MDEPTPATLGARSATSARTADSRAPRRLRRVRPRPARGAYQDLASRFARLAVAAVLAFGAAVSAAPTAVSAAPTAAAGPSSAGPSVPGSSSVEALCPPVGPGYARCMALRRTDLAARFTAGVNPTLDPFGYSPADLRSAYGFPAAPAGAGLTVAVVDAYDLPTAEADLATYRAQYGLPACTTANGCFRKVDQRGGTTYPVPDSGWGAEIALDIEMVSAVCPSCSILLVEADSNMTDDLAAGVELAVRLGASAVSNSYGGPEFQFQLYLDPAFDHPGVAITASTGDYGYGVQYPASSPYVIAVGGTSLVRDSSARGWSETAWAGAGSGCSAYEPKPFWQTDALCARRAVADVAAVADTTTGVATYVSGAGWGIVGGTSVAAPIVAAAYALAGRPAPGSLPGRLLYATPSGLNDVVSGSNASPCTSNLCQAATGYDGPTGVGTPKGVAALAPDIADVSAGVNHSCALTAAGRVSCWGDDSSGQLDVPSGTYRAIAAGGAHTCAIRTDGSLVCWGSNASGQAANSSGPFLAVAAGRANTCAIAVTGSLTCWGDNTYGQRSVPAGTWRAVAVGAGHVCAIDANGNAVCWGDDSHGQASAPVGSFVAISAGTSHTCAVDEWGSATCWGDDTSGQLDGPSVTALRIAAGANTTCASELDGSLHCWGGNAAGQASPPASDAARVAVGGSHACAVLVRGAATTGPSCWGGNANGQSLPAISPSPLASATIGTAYALDLRLSGGEVPAPTYSVAAGSLPPGMTLSGAGHLAGTPSALGTYSFTVVASNGIAPRSSAALTLRVVVTLPGAPRSVAATPGNASVAVTWLPPTSLGTAPLLGYTVTASPGGRTCATSGALACSVTGLTNGTAYTFTVRARNAGGYGPASGPSAAVVPATLPGAPRTVVAYPQHGAALVNWSPPLTDGGRRISSYRVTASPGGLTCTAAASGGNPAATSCTVSGLVDGTAYTFTATATNGLGTGPASVASTAATPSLGALFVPLVPNRIVDSRRGTRLGLAASLGSGRPATFRVVDRAPGDAARNVPRGAVAVTGNLTVVNQTSKGYFSLGPAGAPIPSTSTLNFPAADVRANGVTVPLAADGTLAITFVGGTGATADVVFDVTGYMAAAAGATPGAGAGTPGGTTGASFVPLTPTRLVDSRQATRVGLKASLSSGVPATFQVTGRAPADPSRNVPPEAVAVTGNLTVVDQTARGFFALGPTPSAKPATSTLNFPAGDIRANAVTVPLGAGGTLSVTFAASTRATADVVFDVTGYFVPGTSGATYVPVMPNRLVDSRPSARLGLSAALVSGRPATFQVAGRWSPTDARNVPPTAVAVAGNLTVAGQTSRGFFALGPIPTSAPATSTLNFPAGDIRANATVLPLGQAGSLALVFLGTPGATANAIFDVSGYFRR